LKRRIITTADGSKTIHIEAWNEQYHSKHGAIAEAYHVFIKMGLHYLCHSVLPARQAGGVSESHNRLSILEMGFGTGLNAFITMLEARKHHIQVDYNGIEAYPVSSDEISALNYPELISSEYRNIFEELHQVSWEVRHELSDNFSFTKRKQLFEELKDRDQYDLIYFDAFGPRVQPELWTEAIFENMFNALRSKGVLVTYSAKGSVRRNMQKVGFTVERLEGPPGKREMLRARKEV